MGLIMESQNIMGSDYGSNISVTRLLIRIRNIGKYICIRLQLFHLGVWS